MAGPVRPRKAGPGTDGGHPRRGRRGRIDSGPACPLAGAQVIGTGRSRARPLATELGAGRFLALDAGRLEDAADQADLVLDTIGGEVLARSPGLLRPGGTLVSVNAAAPPPASRDDIRTVVFIQESSRAQLTELARLVDEGHLGPAVGAVYPLARAAEAYSAKAADGIPGRIVLQPSSRGCSDTRAAMTAGSTAVCDQQTAEGASRRSRGAQHLGSATGRRPCPPESWWTTMRSSRRPGQGLFQRHRKWVRPQIPGLSPGGLGPHRTASGFPCGLSSGFPVARRVLPLRPPSSGFPSSGVLRFVPFGRCPVPVPPRFPSGFPFPWAIFTLALPRGGSAGVGPGRQGPRSPVLPRPPRLDRAIRPHSRWAAAGHDGMPPQNRLLRAAAEHRTSPRPNRPERKPLCVILLHLCHSA